MTMFSVFHVVCARLNYLSQNFIRVIKSRRMRWAGHVERVVGMRGERGGMMEIWEKEASWKA